MPSRPPLPAARLPFAGAGRVLSFLGWLCLPPLGSIGHQLLTFHVCSSSSKSPGSSSPSALVTLTAITCAPLKPMSVHPMVLPDRMLSAPTCPVLSEPVIEYVRGCLLTGLGFSPHGGPKSLVYSLSPQLPVYSQKVGRGAGGGEGGLRTQSSHE